MFSTTLKSLVSLCCLISLTALAAMTAPLAGAEPTAAAAAFAATPVNAIAALGDRDDDSDATDQEETYHLVCADTEQPVNPADQIAFVVEVNMHGIRWFEAETADGCRFLIKDIETNVNGGGHGPVQIGRGVYYVCWD